MNRPTDSRRGPLVPLLKAFLVSFAVPFAACAVEPAPGAAREPIVGLPCENCDLVFVGMPPTLSAESRIAPAGEPGEPLRIVGTVLDAAGRPAAGIVVYAYQTDATGHYPGGAVRHGRLRGWAKTDAQGRYAFDTVRPGGYPGTDIPQHVHMHVIEPGRCTYYIDDLLFADDPRLTAAQRASYDRGRGASGVATPVKGADGAWSARRDIRLGEKIPGYPPPR
jgi:protocatechuate 3,4-dioxygenase beta subunit